MNHVIKASGLIESFSHRKLQRSVDLSLLSCRLNIKEATKISTVIANNSQEWIKHKHEVTTKDIRAYVFKQLKIYSEDAAIVYKYIKDIW